MDGVFHGFYANLKLDWVGLENSGFIERPPVIVGHSALLRGKILCSSAGVVEAAAVVNPDTAAIVGYESGFLQNAGGHGDAGAASAEHVREKFLRQGHDVSAEAVLAHQQPARQALVHFMHAIAGGDMGCLHSESLRITVQI